MPQRSDTVYRSALADRLAAQSLTPQRQPIQSSGEGLANMGTMLAQALGAKNIRAGVDEDNAARAQALAKALAPDDPSKQAQLNTLASSPEGLQALQGAYAKSLIPDRTKPKDNLLTVGDRVYDISSGTPKEVVAGMPQPSKTREVKRDGKIVTEEFDPAMGWKQIASSPQFKPEGGAGGPFAGMNMDAQVMNILLDPRADPNSSTYKAAYLHYSQPKVTLDPNTGQINTITPDMSAFRKPGMQGGQGAPAAPAAPAPPGSNPTVAAAPPMPGEPAVAADNAVRVPGAVITQTPGAQPTKFNDAESKAAGFADRMNHSMATLADVEGEGASLSGRALEAVPGGLGNLAQTPEYQKFEQARRDFNNAVLRRESGAVINDEEFKNADRQYFPQPGDSPEVIAQKRVSRQEAYEGMIRSAGKAYTPKKAAEPKVAAPQSAIDHLKKNPRLRDAFDQKYGVGAADSVLGK